MMTAVDVQVDKMSEFAQRELRESVEGAIRFLDKKVPQDWRAMVKQPVDNWSPARNVFAQIFNGQGREFAGLVEELGIHENQRLADAFGYHALISDEECFVNALWNRFLGLQD